MRAHGVALFLTAAVLLPKTGNAQAFALTTPPPQTSAAGASWQINSAPIIVTGIVYYPTRVFRIFDGQVMTQVGVFDRVAVYADTTVEAYSLLYVPVGGARMREYERRRDGELASTTGSRAPSFPVAVATDRAPGEPDPGTSAVSISADLSLNAVSTPRPRAVVAAAPEAATPVATSGVAAASTRRPTGVESIPHPATTEGVWIVFDGARWYASGAAASAAPDRFERVGAYRGFPVYRVAGGRPDEIWVAVVKDGPVAPYRRRR